MPDRVEIARQATEGLRKLAGTIAQTPVLVGFDGFVDSIIQVVDKRTGVDQYEPIPTIDRFGARISAAAGHSSNFELVTTLEKLGGNGPIMANALCTAGFDVTYIGALGLPELHPAFQDFAQKADVHSIANPGQTDALEFDDGKLMMGKYQHLIDVDYDAVENTLGAQTFQQIVQRSRLIGIVNWTMLPKLQTIWEQMADVTLPTAGGKRRLVFIDLCDPAKRTANDLRSAMDVLTKLDAHADVMLGLNLSESSQVASVLGIDVPGDPESAIEATSAAIREKLDIYGVIIHPRKSAAATLRTDTGVDTARFVGPFTSKPKLSTGAGDNFNAGFCLAQLAGLDALHSLCVGNHTSGFYVRHAHSPSLEELTHFLDNPPPAED